MADYLVDTNHLSPLVTSGHPLLAGLLRQVRFNNTFSIAAPALAETLYGIQQLPRAQQNRNEWEKLSVMFYYRSIDRRDAERAATLQIDLQRHGWQLNIVDALIASIALRYNLILLTTDSDFSEITGLQVENWVSSK